MKHAFRPALALLASLLLHTALHAQTLWQSHDLGAPGQTGTSRDNAGAIEIIAAGADIWDNADHGHFRHQTWTGDGEIVVRITSLQNTHPWAKVGLMVRETLQAGSRNAFMCVTPGNGTMFQYRTTTGGASSSGPTSGSAPRPIWLKLARTGNTLTGSTSLNGTTWTQAGTVTLSNLSSSVFTGVALTSHVWDVLNTAHADSFAINASPTPTSPPPSGAPVITAGGTQTIHSGSLFRHQIVATNSPTRYAASGLPAGLTLNTASGEIVGVCGQGGTFTVTLSATNAAGTGTATQTLILDGNPPIEMPSVEHVTLSGATTRRVGDTLSFVVRVLSYYGPVTVTGQPRFSFNLGANTRTATYASGSGTPDHVYTYTLTAEDVGATTLTTADTIDLNGGTLRDPYPLWCALNIRPLSLTGLSIQAANSTPPPDTSSGWQSQDVGIVAAAGSSAASGETITIRGSGADIWDNADEFHFRYQTITGDAEVVARVTSLSNTHPWSKAGIMIRESLASGARHALACVTGANGVTFQQRVATGGLTSTSAAVLGTAYPTWLKLVRSGNTLTGFASSDGATWTTAWTASIGNLPATLYVGLALTSHNDGMLATATFDQVRVTTSTTTTPPPPPPPGPTEPTTPTLAWNFSDIGAVGIAGSNTSSGNTITINAAGADIWDSADGFRFVYRQLSGNGAVEAQVSSMTNTHPWAKAGVMIRQSLAANSANVFAFVTAGAGSATQARSTAGATTQFTPGPWLGAPHWLRLVREGTRIKSFASSDGVSWTEVGAFDVALTETVYIGFAVTSHDTTKLNTAVFTDPFVE
jgi:regulation of enolase protein 1 (concanavalin A-like superfamily)